MITKTSSFYAMMNKKYPNITYKRVAGTQNEFYISSLLDDVDNITYNIREVENGLFKIALPIMQSPLDTINRLCPTTYASWLDFKASFNLDKRIKRKSRFTGRPASLLGYSDDDNPRIYNRAAAYYSIVMECDESEVAYFINVPHVYDVENKVITYCIKCGSLNKVTQPLRSTSYLNKLLLYILFDEGDATEYMQSNCVATKEELKEAFMNCTFFETLAIKNQSID